jgi:class 3 adenylate cyclase
MLIITIFALFGDDFRLAVTPKSADDGFSAAIIVCIILFSIEIIFSCIVRPPYRFSFFFWLDVLSTASLIFDINSVWNSIQDAGGSSFIQSAQIARASRASRAGTRAARIIRVIRVVRLIRIVKLYKLAQEKIKQREAHLLRGTVSCRGTPEVYPMNLAKSPPEFNEPVENSVSQNFESFGNYDANDLDNPNEAAVNKRITTYKHSITLSDAKADIPQESKVGKKLGELTTMRVIILVLIMIFILPFFNLFMWREVEGYLYGLKTIDHYIKKNDLVKAKRIYEDYIDHYKNDDSPLIYIEIDGVNWEWEETDPADLRDVEINIVTLSTDTDYDYYSYSVFDISASSRLQAGINMLKTLFICIVLTTGSVMFSKDTNTIVLEPLENMIRTVKNISKNPLQAIQEEEKNSVIKQEIFEGTFINQKKPSKMMETEILEQLIIKIGALMALGFGEAGSEIIAKNMEQSKGDVDPLVPGKRQLCLFGFCDIRHFADLTEVLEQDIMIFTNEIALILHTSVDECLGVTNRNLGDVFVLVWKFPEEVTMKDAAKSKSLIPGHPFIAQYADLALISYIKMVSELNRNKILLKYNENQRILQKLPNFKVKMGFGMHFGWGIEGAIGSEYKIDASYLSPNVNLASRLCAATKQYGVWMLISEQVHNLFSEKMKKVTRRVDRCTFKGSAVPMNIFTVDLFTSALEPYSPRVTNAANKKKARVAQRTSKEELRKDLWSGAYKAIRRLKEDQDLREVLMGSNPEFVEIFETAISDYLNGQWQVAKEGFLKALKLKEGDGPCMNMIHFIEEYGGVAPADWPGYRKLLEK